MTTIYKDPQGVQVRDFLEENEARLKDKHFLYVVGTNLEEDTYIFADTAQEVVKMVSTSRSACLNRVSPLV